MKISEGREQMNGWVLYNETSEILRAESFELNRFRQVADQCGIELAVISPEQIDLVVTRDDRQSVLLNGKEV